MPCSRNSSRMLFCCFRHTNIELGQNSTKSSGVVQLAPTCLTEAGRMAWLTCCVFMVDPEDGRIVCNLAVKSNVLVSAGAFLTVASAEWHHLPLRSRMDVPLRGRCGQAMRVGHDDATHIGRNGGLTASSSCRDGRCSLSCFAPSLRIATAKLTL